MWKMYFPIYVCFELHRQINQVGILGLKLKKKTMGYRGGLKPGSTEIMSQHLIN